MATENITICPICEQHEFNPYLSAKDYTVTFEVFELKQCRHCHFIVTSPFPDAKSIVKYYGSDNYISHSGTSKTLFDKLYHQARNITLGWKYEMIRELFPEPTNILDYGCGTGEFLNHIKSKGWNVKGIEPNPVAREKANRLLNDKVSENLQAINTNTIEVITLWHVLEHIHDLNSTLQKLKSLLTTNGVIIIAVPNPNSHDCLHYKKYWAGYDVPRHLWHFTQNTMTALLNKNGLNVEAIKPMKLDGFYVSLLSEGYKNPEQSKLVNGIKAFARGLTSNRSAKKTKEYSSLIYIAKPE